MIKKLHNDYGLSLLCDFHGHSKLYNAFMYGCRSLESPADTKLFPYILSKVSTHFAFECCKFGAYRFKETTARVCMYRELERVPAVYTLEASFCGSSDGTVHTPQVLKSIGKDLCRALIPYCNLNVSFSVPATISSAKARYSSHEYSKKRVIGTEWKNELLSELKRSQELLNVGDVDECSGSDSAPSDDNLPDNIMAKIVPHELVKRNRSTKKTKPPTLMRRSKKSAFTLKKPADKIGEGRDKVRSVQSFKKSTVTSFIERIKSRPQQLAKRHKPLFIMIDNSMQTEAKSQHAK